MRQCLDLEEIVKLTKFQFDDYNRRPLRSYGGRDEQRTIEQILHVTLPEIPEQTARGVKVIHQELPQSESWSKLSKSLRRSMKLCD